MNTLVKCVLAAGLFVAVSAAPSVAQAESGFMLKTVRLIDTGDSGSVTSAATLIPKLKLNLTPVGADSGGFLPCLMSCVIPGLGQLFNGQMMKGLIVFGAAVVASILTSYVHSIFGILSLVVWVAAMVDAYNGGTLIPFGSAGDAPRRVIRTDDVQPVARPVGATI